MCGGRWPSEPGTQQPRGPVSHWQLVFSLSLNHTMRTTSMHDDTRVTIKTRSAPYSNQLKVIEYLLLSKQSSVLCGGPCPLYPCVTHIAEEGRETVTVHRVGQARGVRGFLLAKGCRPGWSCQAGTEGGASPAEGQAPSQSWGGRAGILQQGEGSGPHQEGPPGVSHWGVAGTPSGSGG